MDNFDLSKLTNEQLEEKLHDEFLYYTEDLRKLCHIIRKQLPRKMVYRIISKLFRLRVEKTNIFLRKASHYKNCKRLKGDKCEEPHCQYSRCVLSTDPEQAGFFCNRDGK